MPVKVYGPDAFTVGADVNLNTYDANWERVLPADASWAGVVQAKAATDDLRATNASAASYRWNGQTLVGQKILGKLLAGAGDYPGFHARLTPTPGGGANRVLGYLAEWQATENLIQIYRITEPGGVLTYATIASAGVVGNGSTYTGAYLRATGTNPVHLEYGDNTQGPFTFDDSNAARAVSGQPGVSFSDALPISIWIDDVEVWDEDAIAPVGNPWRLAIQQRAG
jgi:hypothetical protein